MNARAFLRIVQALVGDGARSVVVDLGPAEVDASGLPALVMARGHIERCRGELVLRSPHSNTLKLLSEADLIDRFPVC